MDKVLLDTTVLCGAFLTRGVNYRIIQLARSSELFEPVISEVVVCEFIEHCRKGMRGIVYSEDDIDDFFTAVKPVLDTENIRRIGIGKELWVDMTKSQRPIGDYLYNLFYSITGRKRDDLLVCLDEEDKKLAAIDSGDIHVMFAAIEHDCDIILTANKDDFPTRLGKIEIIRPQAYYEYLVTITGDV